jgi:hypothetical protein
MKTTPKRTRVHTRRTHRRVRRFDWELEQFTEQVGRIPNGVNPQGILRALADHQEFWELVGLAERLRKSREEVLEKISKIRDEITKPFLPKKKRSPK